MKSLFYKIFVLSVFGLTLFAAELPAQTGDEYNRRVISAASSIYVISANAGGVNFTEGKVSVVRKNGKSGYLIKGDNLEVGDKATTASDGKAEILLNPGSFARLAENSEIEFVNTSLEDLKIKVLRGSVMFEVIADRDFRISVSSPKSDFYLIKSGIYRIDAASDGTAKLEVWKGNAQVGDGKTAVLKGGQSAAVNGNQTAVTKFDRDDKDALEQWSKSRSKELAKINSTLDRRNLRNSLISSSRGWNIYDSFGLWVFNPISRSYCFLPFGYGWSSPYGYWFGRDIWSVPLPTVIYTGGNSTPTTRTGTLLNPNARGQTAGGNSVGQSERGQVKDRGETKERDFRPPFTKVQRDIGMEPVFSPGPVFSPAPSKSESFPTASPSVPSAPSSGPTLMIPPVRSKDN